MPKDPNDGRSEPRAKAQRVLDILRAYRRRDENDYREALEIILAGLRADEDAAATERERSRLCIA